MIYEKSRGRALLLSLFALCAALCLVACKASRQTAQTTHVAVTALRNDSGFTDNIEKHDTIREERRQSVISTVTEAGTILVYRDSIGRPERFEWSLSAAQQEISSTDEKKETSESRLQDSRHSASADSIHSDSESETKAAQNVDTTIHLSGWLIILIAVSIIFLNHVLPWIIKRFRR